MVRRRLLGPLLATVLSACGTGGLPAQTTGNPTLATTGTIPTPTATPSPSPTTAVTAGPAAAGRILFESTRDSSHAIFEMDPDGSHVVALPNGPHDHQPDWSPDHRRIAFTRDSGGKVPGIYVMDADGTNVRLVIRDSTSDAEFPVWSPDGTRLAYASTPSGGGIGTSSLVVVNVDGTGRHVVSHSPAGSIRAAWSPDGQWIVFFEGTGCDLCAVHPDGTGQHRLAAADPNSTAGFGFPSWSPDGRTIAFQRDQRIVVINADGSGATDLTSGVADDEFVDWSPDGSWLVFARFSGGGSALQVIRADGSDPLTLSKDTTLRDTLPSWQ